MVKGGSALDQETKYYSIQDLTRDFDVTARTLRHYEDQGLITPARVGQHRHYSMQDRVRLGWILRGKRVGFSLSDIKDMLDLYDLNDNRETQRKVTLEKCREKMLVLQQQKKDIEATLSELEAFCSLLITIKKDLSSGKWIDGRTGQPAAFSMDHDKGHYSRVDYQADCEKPEEDQANNKVDKKIADN